MGDPFVVETIPVAGQDRHRDTAFVDVQAEIDRPEMGDTGHGRLLPYLAPSAPSWMTHAQSSADWSRPPHAD
jgi:hypothetical protein